MSELRHVVVTGLMGVGKTTTADALGAALGRPVRDSDRDIETTFGRTGARIAEAYGVDELHRLEAAMLLGALASPTPLVIAAAGWVIEDQWCREALVRRARTIVLAAPTTELVRRAASGRHRRPVSAADFDAQLAVRGPWFDEVAVATIDTTLPHDEVIAAALTAVGGRTEP